MQAQNIIVFDFETNSSAKSTAEIIQIGALALNPRNLAPYPGPDAEFESMVRMLKPEAAQAEALRVNKKTVEEIQAAPHPQEVWHAFATWVKRWNLRGKSDSFSAPIAAGHNITGFDWPIYDRYCRAYGTTRTEKNGEVVPGLFHTIYRYDTLHLLGAWHENNPDLNKLSLDYLRRYFAVPHGTRETHDALQDVRDTAAILVKILGLMRRVGPTVVWKDCFDGEKVAAEIDRRKAERGEREAKAIERESAQRHRGRKKEYAS